MARRIADILGRAAHRPRPHRVEEPEPDYGRPGQVEPARAQRWIEGVAISQREQTWTPALVRARLDDAMRIIPRLAGRVGPKEYGNAMPTVTEPLALGQLVQMLNTGTLRLQSGPPAHSALSREISCCEEAIYWPIKYLAAWPGPRGVLHVWMRARAQREPWSRALRRARLPRSTARDARERALRLIAQGLQQDGVPIR